MWLAEWLFNFLRLLGISDQYLILPDDQMNLSLCEINNNIPNFICPHKGNFANPKDPLCKSYFICRFLTNGTMVQYSYICPEKTWFDPSLKGCNAFYKCPCDDVITPQGLTTPQSPTTTGQCSTDSNIPDFQCSEEGNFANPKDLTCKSYQICRYLRDGSIVQFSNTCPDGSWFDPYQKQCDTFYKCPCENIGTTTPSQACQKNTPEFVCQQEGNFADLRDFTCQNYFICRELRNGLLLQHPYTCPADSKFDPSEGRCSQLYKCPCENEKNTTIPDQCNFDGTPFQCKKSGNFFNSEDPSCKSYYLCRPLRNGTMVQYVYKCPMSSLFDPEAGRCSSLFNCPCISN